MIVSLDLWPYSVFEKLTIRFGDVQTLMVAAGGLDLIYAVQVQMLIACRVEHRKHRTTIFAPVIPIIVD